MKKSVVIVLAVAMYAIPAPPLFGCQCRAPSVSVLRQRSKAVFIGKSVRVEAVDVHTNEITLVVLRSWKGVRDATVRVRTNRGAGSCGFAPRDGGTYLIFASPQGNDPLRTDMCSGNMPALCATKAWLRQFGKPIWTNPEEERLRETIDPKKPIRYPSADLPCITPPEMISRTPIPLPECEFQQQQRSACVCRPVRLELTIDHTGLVHQTRVLQSSGSDVFNRRVGNSPLNGHWRFKPATWGGRPISVITEWRIEPFVAVIPMFSAAPDPGLAHLKPWLCDNAVSRD